MNEEKKLPENKQLSQEVKKPKDPAVKRALRRQASDLLCIFIAALLVILAA